MIEFDLDNINEERNAETHRALRTDDLHSDPRELASRIADIFGDNPWGDLLVALTATEKNATAGDNVILQHGAAMAWIDKWVQKVIDWEEKQR